ncbi:MAG: hypothetical protein ABFD97_10405 [Syntrophobacter sp.]
MMVPALVMLPAALLSYNWAGTIPSLIVPRIFHGTAFVHYLAQLMEAASKGAPIPSLATRAQAHG